MVIESNGVLEHGFIILQKAFQKPTLLSKGKRWKNGFLLYKHKHVCNPDGGLLGIVLKESLLWGPDFSDFQSGPLQWQSNSFVNAGYCQRRTSVLKTLFEYLMDFTVLNINAGICHRTNLTQSQFFYFLQDPMSIVFLQFIVFLFFLSSSNSKPTESLSQSSCWSKLGNGGKKIYFHISFCSWESTCG